MTPNKFNSCAHVLPRLRQFGKRHVAYGVMDGHCATAGGTMLKTLETGLGSAFDAPELVV